MKRHLRLSLLLIVCCLIHCALFGQDSLSRVYSIKFNGYKTNLSKEARASLSDIAKIMQDHPNYCFAVIGNCTTENQRLSQTIWERTNNIITYLVEKHSIKAERFIFKYDGEPDDCNTIELKFTTDSPDIVPPPHPSLRKKVNDTKTISN